MGIILFKYLYWKLRSFTSCVASSGLEYIIFQFNSSSGKMLFHFSSVFFFSICRFYKYIIDKLVCLSDI